MAAMRVIVFLQNVRKMYEICRLNLFLLENPPIGTVQGFVQVFGCYSETYKFITDIVNGAINI